MLSDGKLVDTIDLECKMITILAVAKEMHLYGLVLKR